MILQALASYYDRASDLAPEGWEWKRIPYVVEIRQDGSFVQLSSMRTGSKATDVKPSLVPKAEIRSGPKAYERPNLLWDHYGFVLGHAKTDSQKDRLTAQQQIKHFTHRVQALIADGLNDVGLEAVANFYRTDGPKQVRLDPLWSECEKTPGCNLTFRLVGDVDLVVQRQGVCESAIKSKPSVGSKLKCNKATKSTV